MPIGDILMLGLILSMFGVFMGVLAWGAWWSSRAPRPAPTGVGVVRPDADWGLAPSRGGSGW
jgi:hypothetical protein